MLCSVGKHAGSGSKRKEVNGKTQDVVESFASPLECSSCFLSALQQSREQSTLLYLFITKNPLNSPSMCLTQIFKLKICKRLSCSQEISYSLLTVLRTKNLGAQRVDRGQAFHLSTILLKKLNLKIVCPPSESILQNLSTTE